MGNLHQLQPIGRRKKKLIIAVVVSKNTKNYDCDTCHHKHCDESRQRPGSRGPAGFDKWKIPGIIKSKVCLLPMITDESREWLNLYTHYKNRLLPFAGGIYDQPAAWKQALEIIESHVNQ